MLLLGIMDKRREPPTDHGPHVLNTGCGASAGRGQSRGRGRFGWYADLSFPKLVAHHVVSQYGSHIETLVCEDTSDVQVFDGHDYVFLLNPQHAYSLLAEYVALKRKANQVGAYLILPKQVARAQAVAPLLHDMQRVLEGRRTETLQLKDSMGAYHEVTAPWSFEVWHDKKRPSIWLVRKKHAKAQMMLRGMVAGALVDCVVDTGAELSFISEEFLKKVQVAPGDAEEHVEVELATGVIAKVVGQVKLRTVFKSLPCTHTYQVLPTLAGGCDVLLGLDFLTRHKSVINVGEGTCTFWHRGRGVIVKALKAAVPTAKTRQTL